jgi:hypothetical protein
MFFSPLTLDAYLPFHAFTTLAIFCCLKVSSFVFKLLLSLDKLVKFIGHLEESGRSETNYHRH